MSKQNEYNALLDSIHHENIIIIMIIIIIAIFIIIIIIVITTYARTHLIFFYISATPGKTKLNVDLTCPDVAP